VEFGCQQLGAVGRHFLDDRPRKVDFIGRRAFSHQLANAGGPALGILLPDVVDDRWIGGGPYCAMLNGVGQLIDGARVVPDVGGGRSRLLQRAQAPGIENADHFRT
jgi:hypothetical protein